MKSNRGFSLIEALITLILVSIGVLGMVALQTRTLQNAHDSVQRNAAAALANDLLESMRAQPVGLPATSGFYKEAGAAFPDEPAAGCSNTPLDTSKQLACWAKKVKAMLPGVTDDLLSDEFYVCRTTNPGTCTSGAGSAVEIQIAWTVKKGECMDSTQEDDAESTTCRYRLRAEL
jgi:type IV pilus assembly protein PilV